MDKATFIDLMDKYIDGAMSGSEKYDFEQMLINDPQLNEDFNLHKTLRKGIKLTGRQELARELQSIKKEVNSNSEHSGVPFNKKWYLAIAAVMVAILAALFVFKNNNDVFEPIYAGKYEMKTMPAEGKFGSSPSTQTIELILKASQTYEYEIVNDTLVLYCNPSIIKDIELLTPMFILNSQRNIEMDINNKIIIFNKK